MEELFVNNNVLTLIYLGLTGLLFYFLFLCDRLGFGVEATVALDGTLLLEEIIQAKEVSGFRIKC
jgi:hypothetical protein